MLPELMFYPFLVFVVGTMGWALSVLWFTEHGLVRMKLLPSFESVLQLSRHIERAFLTKTLQR